MTGSSEHTLVKNTLRGDARSAEALYRRFSVPMFRVCLRYARDRSEAEDMLQEGFMRVFADLKDFRFEGSLEGWIRRVVLRAALRLLRNRQPFDQLEDPPETAETPDPGEPPVRPDDAWVARLMQQLPPGYRTVLNLYAIEGYNHEEIAGLLGISVGTSKSQLSKARAMLKKMLAKTMTTQP